MSRLFGRVMDAGRPGMGPLQSMWLAGIAALVFFGQAPPAAALAPTIEGKWLTDDRSAVVTIAHCGDRLCGNVSKILNSSPDVPRTDVNNPQPRLRSRPILGLPVLAGFRQDGHVWTGGRAYDPKSGTSYRSELKLNGDGSLNVKGCVLFICESKRWTRQA